MVAEDRPDQHDGRITSGCEMGQGDPRQFRRSDKVQVENPLKCMGGQIFGRLLFRNDDERARATKAGITNFDRVYTRDDLVTGDVIFAATGVTDGSLVPGIKREVGFVTAETILMRSKTGSVRRMIYRNPVR